MKNKRQIFYKI